MKTIYVLRDNLLSRPLTRVAAREVHTRHFGSILHVVDVEAGYVEAEYVNVNIGFPSSGAFPGNSSTKPVKRESERNDEKVAQQQHIHKQDGNIMAP